METAQPSSIPLAAILLLGVAWSESVFPEELALQGSVLVVAVDERRILVAIDGADGNRALDGRVDHVFLFTASEPIDIEGLQGRGPAHLHFSGSRLILAWQGPGRSFELVVPNEHSPALGPPRKAWPRYEKAIGLSHYWGLGALSFDDLREIRQSETCDHVPGSCYEANGFPLPFPA